MAPMFFDSLGQDERIPQMFCLEPPPPPPTSPIVKLALSTLGEWDISNFYAALSRALALENGGTEIK